MNIKINLVSARGRHTGRTDPEGVALLRTGAEGIVFTAFLTGFYFLACFIH